MSIVFGTSQSHLTELEDGSLVHKDVVKPWIEFQSAAAQDGIELKIASAFRNFERQLLIWNRKHQGEAVVKDDNGNVVIPNSLSELEFIKAIMRFSALPGTSRHHWGTDIDVYSPQLLAGKQLQLEPWEYQIDGPMAKLTAWIDKNMKDHGFYRPYNRDRGGVAIEPWHLSYAEISEQYFEALSVNNLAKLIQTTQISGKSTILKNLEYLYEQYVINIGNFDD